MAQMKLGTFCTRRDSAANWEQINPILANGEQGYDITNRLIKIGDGHTAWNDLPIINKSKVITGELAGTQGGEEYLNSLNEDCSIGDRAVLRRLLSPATDGEKYSGYENVRVTEHYRIGTTLQNIAVAQQGTVYYHITPAMRKNFDGFCIVKEGSNPYATNMNFMLSLLWYSDGAQIPYPFMSSVLFSNSAILERPGDTLVVKLQIMGTQKIVGAYLYNGKLPLGYVPIDKSMFLDSYDKSYHRITWPYDNSKLGMVLTTTGTRNFTALIPGDDENNGNLGLFSCPYLVIVTDPINSNGPVSADIRAWTPAGEVIIDSINGTDAKLSNANSIRCFDLTRVGDCSPMFLEIWVTDASFGIKEMFLSQKPVNTTSALTEANVGAGYVTASGSVRVDVYSDSSKSKFEYSVMMPVGQECSLPYVNSINITNTDKWVNLADNSEFTCPHTFPVSPSLVSVCPSTPESMLDRNYYVPRNITSTNHTHPQLQITEYPENNYISVYSSTAGDKWISFVYERQSLGQEIDFTFTNNINKYVPKATNPSMAATYCVNIGYTNNRDVPPASSIIKPLTQCTINESKWSVGSITYGAQNYKYVWISIYLTTAGQVGMEYPYLRNDTNTNMLSSPVRVMFSGDVNSYQVCYYNLLPGIGGTLTGKINPPKATQYGYNLIGWKPEDSDEIIDFSTLAEPSTIAVIKNKTLVPVFENSHVVNRLQRATALPTRYEYESYYYDGAQWELEDQAIDENIVTMLRDINVTAGDDKNILLGSVSVNNGSPRTVMGQIESNRVWLSLESAQEFARTSSAAYPGMVLSVLDMNNGRVTSSTSYRINDSFGTLVELGGGSGVVDSELDPNSTNPVQNKVITEYVNHALEVLDQVTQSIGDIDAILDAINGEVI